MEEELVSIIVPCYNVEKYLIRCLKSIERQTYKNLEIILIDDGSADSTYELATRFQKNSPIDLKVLRQKNSGVSCARNLGIKVSTGKYLCFVDSDDELNCLYIYKLYQAIVKQNVDVAFCRHNVIDEKSNVTRRTKDSGDVVNLESLTLLYKMLYHEESFAIWSLLAKRSLFTNIRFYEGCRYSEDLEVVWEIVGEAKNVCIVSEALYYYRKRQGSAMSFVNDRRLDGLAAMHRLESFFSGKNEEFYIEFMQYIVPRWVWATLWQEAIAAPNYQNFIKRIDKYDAFENIKKLKTYRQWKVRCSSTLFLYAPRIYYLLVRIFCGRNNYLDG